MASRTDFLTLYQRLGVRPDCGEAEFKNAYRRLISELHPDRQASRGGHVDAGVLSELINDYNAAMAFRRQHGRLPGAARPAPASARPRPTRPKAAQSPVREPRTERRTGRTLLVLLPLALLVAAALTRIGDGETRVEGRAAALRVPTLRPAEPSPPRADKPPPVAAYVELGLDAEAVLAIQGKPMVRGESRWDYGPSWIAFEEGHVSNWYSSPLRPLRTTKTRPPDATDRPH